ncbi:MAG: ParB/RepB/Spo0J family partition protein [Betaproteobacteria bacterium]|nr:ParB/RepB/Spo0J family partition protein [Betaproteobacteria bacterium]
MKLRDEENISQGEITPVSPAPVIIQKIRLDLLVPSPYNSRKFRPEQSIQDMAQSLREHGQREALRVYPGEGEQQGKYAVVSGVTRLLAAKSLNALEASDWQTLDVIVDPTLNPNNPLALVIASRIHNSMSKETDMDHAATVADLEEKGYSQEAIMLAMGFKTTSKLYRLRAFKNLPQAILNIAAQHPNKVTAEFADILKNAVSQLGEEKAVLLAEELISKKLSKRKLIERVKTEYRKIASTFVRVTKERGALLHFANRKIGELRVMRHSDSDKQEVQLKIQPPEDATQDFFVELESFIQRVMEKW